MELEDLGFAALYPLRYSVLDKAVQGSARPSQGGAEQDREVDQAPGPAGKHCRGAGHSVAKSTCTACTARCANKTLSFEEIYDVYAFRIIVDDVDTCYRMLGVVHNLYKPVPGKFKDYIAIPKANGYQSLHTILFGPYGIPIEVQIRTEDMDKVAESGVAAHWLYKSGERRHRPDACRVHVSGCSELLEMQKHAGNSLEFLESVKIDLFPDEVYVFTPDGRDHEAAAWRHRDRLRLRGAYRYRQHLHRRARRPAGRAAADHAAQRPDGGDHHGRGGAARVRPG